MGNDFLIVALGIIVGLSLSVALTETGIAIAFNPAFWNWVGIIVIAVVVLTTTTYFLLKKFGVIKEKEVVVDQTYGDPPES